ncbi:MAG: DUF502 domain-containing protein [Brevinema sp.]
MKKKSSPSNIFKDGILLLLPVGMTIVVIYWGWSLLRGFIPDLSLILPRSIIERPHFSQFLDLISLVFFIIIITIFGMLASTFLGKFFLFLFDKILMGPTFIRPIYTTFKKITESIFQKESGSPLSAGISESILIPYPNKESQSIGFITSLHAKHLLGEEEGEKWLTVYVPSAPVVSAGFYLLCRKKDTEPCKLNSGNAMTTIISVGAVRNTSELSPKEPIETSKDKYPNFFRIWFINGILLLTPIIATVYILGWIFNYLYTFITNISRLLPNPFSITIPAPYDNIIINIIIFVILLLMIMIIGLLGESAFGIWVKTLSTRLFHSIPMFNKVYGIVEQIIKVFSPDPSKSSTFDKAVLVPYPSDATYAVGFITGTDANYIKSDNAGKYCPVFIPTTPIPTTGWFIIAEVEKIIPLDMPIEKAFALVISAGILTEDEE